MTCLIPALRNVRLPKDFKGPRKVPNNTVDQPPEAWVKSYEMAMEMLDVDEAACAKYFTMMLEGTARTWLKNLPANSIGSWAELRARFIQNFKDKLFSYLIIFHKPWLYTLAIYLGIVTRPAVNR